MRFLIDKSALARWPKPNVAPRLDALSRKGLLAVCGAVEVEVSYTGRSKADVLRIRHGLRGIRLAAHPGRGLGPGAGSAAHARRERQLACRFRMDLIIAATAERHGATVLHYDGDYDMIAAVTGQPAEWVAPPGTADITLL